MEPPYFDIPPLFSLICLFWGSVFILSPLIWLDEALRNERGRDFKGVFLSLIGRAAFLTPAFSLFFALGSNQAVVGVMPEIIVMSVIGTIYLRFQIKDLKSRAEKISHISRVLEKEVLGLMGLVFSVLALFFVTGFIGYCVIVVVKNLGAHGWIEWAAAIIGGVYIAVLIGLYMLLKERQSALFDHGKNSFQGVLMVLAAGLLLFIVPLLMYQAAYNPKTYEKLHPTPPVNRI